MSETSVKPIEQEQPGLWQELATRTCFFIGGFGIASWAPLVPLFKTRLALNEGVLGLLLLCIGGGALISMPLSGLAAARFGCRKVLTVAACLYAGFLLALSQVRSFWLAVPVLLAFGASMGLVDVTVNIQAVLVEKAVGKRLMSGFHAFWSVGCFMGAGLFAVWLKLGLSPEQATGGAVLLILLLLIIFSRHLLPYGGSPKDTSLFAVPRGIVTYIGVICCLGFVVEGAMLDWSGVFLAELKGVDFSLAGTGFAVFSAAMLSMRLTGDWLTQKLGGRFVVLYGTGLAVAGFAVLLCAQNLPLLYAGFFAIGIGCANIVPVFYSLLGRQKVMPISMAVAAVSILGYVGTLMGPAVIGFIAHRSNLYVSFGFLAVLLVVLILIARHVYKKVL